MVNTADAMQLDGLLKDLLTSHRLSARYQPIMDLRQGTVFSHEGLIRGPSDSALHSPFHLFNAADRAGLSHDVEREALQTLVSDWAKLGDGRCLFLNLSPGALVRPKGGQSVLPDLEALGVRPDSVVIELTERDPAFDYATLVEAANQLRALGYTIAMDDLGEGSSSLRLWSELHPEFVKIDMHFVQGVAFNPMRFQFLRTLHDLASSTGARLVAEGIETESDLAAVQDIGIELGQGYLFGRPEPNPIRGVGAQLAKKLREGAVGGTLPAPRTFRATAEKFMMLVEPVAPSMTNNAVHERFQKDHGLESLPVVRENVPVGIITRNSFMDFMSGPFSRDLYGRKPCETVMNHDMLVADKKIPVQELSEKVVNSDRMHIAQGFVLTSGGFYAGMGSGFDLLREITTMQVTAARYANPLSLLPGNVPTHENVDFLLDSGQPFVVAYCDLDHFKPFNDTHGYRLGDDVIRWTATLLAECFHRQDDFVGHIGGDDFIVVMQNLDWEPRVQNFLSVFKLGRDQFFSPEEIAKGFYDGENRRKEKESYPLLSISIGLAYVQRDLFLSHHEVSTSCTSAKIVAKGIVGCSYFMERRKPKAGVRA